MFHKSFHACHHEQTQPTKTLQLDSGIRRSYKSLVSISWDLDFRIQKSSFASSAKLLSIVNDFLILGFLQRAVHSNHQIEAVYRIPNFVKKKTPEEKLQKHFVEHSFRFPK